MFQRALGILLMIAGCGVFAFWWAARPPTASPAALAVCNLVSEKIYLADVSRWSRACRQAASGLGGRDAGTVAEVLRGQLGALRVSHLELYDAAASRQVWTGVAEENGLVSEFVDGELAVFRVHPKSPAADAGLRYGDVIVSIDGENPSPRKAAAAPGVFAVRRKSKTFTVTLKPREVSVDDDVEIRWRGDAAVVRVPSFRAAFFEKEKWTVRAKSLGRARRIVVDLRGNAGGNFVAGLRFLSPFTCGPRPVGRLTKPKGTRGTEGTLPDDLRDQMQLDLVDRADDVRLTTFGGYGCLRAPVTVLVDSGAASTAELVAQALRDEAKARVWGVRTAGQLLVGVWYDVPELGPGWRLSVPEAVYETRRGARIEGEGVVSERDLYDSLREMQNGRDAWIEAALAPE